MNLELRKPLAALTIAVFAASLGGCLSKDDSGVETSVVDPVPTANRAPTISGSPGNAVMLGDSYAFTPSASDPDGDTLTFSIQNQPSWASFDANTGTLTGQPLLGDLGAYDQIVISVSDGTDSSSLTAFSITATQAALGSMTLAWTPPVTNTDGSALTDLAGYRIYYGLSEGNYPNRIDVDSAGVATYVVDNLLPDTYYIVATSINTSGVESDYSNITIKTVEGS